MRCWQVNPNFLISPGVLNPPAIRGSQRALRDLLDDYSPDMFDARPNRRLPETCLRPPAGSFAESGESRRDNAFPLTKLSVIRNFLLYRADCFPR